MKESLQTQIYIGLSDGLTREQMFSTEKYLSIMKNVCKNYSVAFSVNVVEGGYFHHDGSYVEETTLVITLMEVEKETAEEIARDLCVFFRQESVMITRTAAETYFIEERV